MRARGRNGFGWKRWSSKWLYDGMSLFNDYQLGRWSARNLFRYDRPHNPCD